MLPADVLAELVGVPVAVVHVSDGDNGSAEHDAIAKSELLKRCAACAEHAALQP